MKYGNREQTGGYLGLGEGLTIKSEDNVLGLNCDGGIHLPESTELYTYKGYILLCVTYTSNHTSKDTNQIIIFNPILWAF